MSEPDGSAKNFLRRWSQRKRAQQSARDAAPAPSRERMDAETNAPSDAAASGEAVPPAFDPATLPPIESITAISDVRAFLAPGVPDELTRAALRRVWMTDPMIRDFVGIAENQWDFTKPDSVPGFGSLEFTPELRRMIAGLIGEAVEPATPQRHPDAELNDQTKLISSPPRRPVPDSLPVTSQSNNYAAMQKSTKGDVRPRPAQRKHGGAVPK